MKNHKSKVIYKNFCYLVTKMFKTCIQWSTLKYFCLVQFMYTPFRHSGFFFKRRDSMWSLNWSNISRWTEVQFLFTYLCLLLLIEQHRLLTSIFHPTLSWTIISSCFQLLLDFFFIFASNFRCTVFFGLSLSGFQVNACLVIKFGDFLNVYHLNHNL